MPERAVLFVDDDEIVLQNMERSLEDEAYDRHFAGSCAEALDILRRALGSAWADLALRKSFSMLFTGEQKTSMPAHRVCVCSLVLEELQK